MYLTFFKVVSIFCPFSNSRSRLSSVILGDTFTLIWLCFSHSPCSKAGVWQWSLSSDPRASGSALRSTARLEPPSSALRLPGALCLPASFLPSQFHNKSAVSVVYLDRSICVEHVSVSIGFSNACYASVKTAHRARTSKHSILYTNRTS